MSAGMRVRCSTCARAPRSVASRRAAAPALQAGAALATMTAAARESRTGGAAPPHAPQSDSHLAAATVLLPAGPSTARGRARRLAAAAAMAAGLPTASSKVGMVTLGPSGPMPQLQTWARPRASPPQPLWTP